MAAISQTIFSYAFSWMTFFLFWLKNSLKFVPKGPINIYLNQCWPNSLTHICGTRGRWVKIHLWLTDTTNDALTNPVKCIRIKIILGDFSCTSFLTGVLTPWNVSLKYIYVNVSMKPPTFLHKCGALNSKLDIILSARNLWLQKMHRFLITKV